MIDAGAAHWSFVDRDVDGGVALEAGDHVEASATSGTLEGVGGVGELLEFVNDEVGDDHRGLDKPCACDVGDSAIDEGGGVEEDGADATDLLGEFDVRNDEAEVVLGLQDRDNAQIAQADADDDLDGLDDGLPLAPRDVGPTLQQQVKEAAHNEGGE